MSKLPDGQHLVCIVKGEPKRNAKNTGGYIALTMECLSGAHKGKTFTDYLNVVHESETAKRIGIEKLALYARVLALDIKQVTDTKQMCFRPFVVEVGQGKDRSTVKAVHPMPTEWTDAERARAVALCAEVSFRGPTPPTAAEIAQAGSAEAKSPNIIGWGEFVASAKPPIFVWHRVLQAGYLVALTAYWGAGKTAIAVSIALHVATGRELARHPTDACKVLYLCGENPPDVAMRAKKAAEVFGMDDSELVGNIHFTRRPFAIDSPQALADFVADVREHGPFGLVIVDTGPAHSEAEDEDDNRQAHKLAMALRDLMRDTGDPALLVLMHPAKNASQENMTPRGGGAFAGSVDGLLCAWQDLGVTELYRHPQKFRGPPFEPMCFKMEAHTVDGMADNFGEPVETVVAVALGSDEQTSLKSKPKALTGVNLFAFNALIDLQPQADPVPLWVLQQPECLAFGPAIVVSKEKWRQRCMDKGISSGNAEAARKAFDRAHKALLASGKVHTVGDLYWAYEWVRPKKELLQPALGMLM